jgi:sec-independent protein translocase protein TatB
MFDIGWSEFVLIGIVALIAIGPKELPGALRTLGQWMGKLRRMAAEFQGQFQEAMREAEVADLKKQVDEMTAQAQSYANVDPIADVQRELETTQHQIENAMTEKPPEPGAAGAQDAGSTGHGADSAPAQPAELPAPASTPSSEPVAAAGDGREPGPGGKAA